MLSKEQIDKLKELAAVNPQGQWHSGCGEVQDDEGALICTVSGWKSRAKSNMLADYIAAANPAAILELIAMLEASQKDAARLREVVEDAAEEWAQYVEVDTAPRTLKTHMMIRLDAAMHRHKAG